MENLTERRYRLVPVNEGWFVIVDVKEKDYNNKWLHNGQVVIANSFKQDTSGRYFIKNTLEELLDMFDDLVIDEAYRKECEDQGCSYSEFVLGWKACEKEYQEAGVSRLKKIKECFVELQMEVGYLKVYDDHSINILRILE